jgi:hypothetical protein
MRQKQTPIIISLWRILALDAPSCPAAQQL